LNLIEGKSDLGLLAKRHQPTVEPAKAKGVQLDIEPCAGMPCFLVNQKIRSAISRLRGFTESIRAVKS
jgi:hypothetical protein